MTTLSTHDTKRGEDVRARLAVLVRAARRVGRGGATGGCAAAPLPDPALAHLLWQTVVGRLADRAASGCTRTWRRRPARRRRRHELGATRTRRSRRPCAAVVDRIYDDPALRADVAAFVAGDHAGRLVQLARPEAGAARHARRAGRLPGHRAVGQLAGRPGQPAAGRLRRPARAAGPDRRRLAAAGRRERARRSCWSPAGRCGCAGSGRSCSPATAPVLADGPAAEHVLAFDRGGVVAVATRLPVGLARRGGWGDTTLSLAGRHAGRTSLTGRQLRRQIGWPVRRSAAHRTPSRCW